MRNRDQYMYMNGECYIRRADGTVLRGDGEVLSMENGKASSSPIAAFAAAFAGDLHNAAIASTPGGTERQEARGQQSVCSKVELPCKSPWDQLKKLGIKELEDHDKVFQAGGRVTCRVSLPSGWKIEPTSHSMWNNLVDAKGRIRSTFFYKAAFYDMDAFMHLDTRFHLREVPEDEYKDPEVTYDIRSLRPWRAVVEDRTKTVGRNSDGTRKYEVIFSTPWTAAKDQRDYLGSIGGENSLGNRLLAVAAKWLKEKYPLSADPLAYWDDPEETAAR